jgi:hypothetical protein
VGRALRLRRSIRACAGLRPTTKPLADHVVALRRRLRALIAHTFCAGGRRGKERRSEERAQERLAAGAQRPRPVDVNKQRRQQAQLPEHSVRGVAAGSNCLGCQGVTGLHGVAVRSRLLHSTSNLRMHATSATLAGLPALRRPPCSRTLPMPRPSVGCCETRPDRSDRSERPR